MNLTQRAPLPQLRWGEGSDGLLSLEEEARLRELQRRIQSSLALLDAPMERFDRGLAETDFQRLHKALEADQAEVVALIRAKAIRGTPGPRELRPSRGGALFGEEAAARYLTRLESSLPPSEALLQIALSEGRSYGLLLRGPEDRRLIALPPGDTTAELMEAWRHVVHHRGEAGMEIWAEQARAAVLQPLFDCLLAPFMPLLGETRCLRLLLPSLWYDLPVAALPCGEQYLIERLEIDCHDLRLSGRPLVVLSACDTGRASPGRRAI